MALFDLSGPLAARRREHLFRSRRTLQSPQGPRVVVDGQPCRNFCSNDYLGLASDPRIAEALTRAVAAAGVGSGASHLVIGHHEYHQQLENQLADWLGVERALLFSTGYMANLAVISALLDKQDAVFEDRLNHASLLDGGLLSGARFQRYLHGNLDNLRSRLENTKARRKLVVTDGVFSMDGDIAPLPRLQALCDDQGAALMVDDAHGFAVLGEAGRGSAAHWGMQPREIDILVGTLGKGFGTAGAFVAGSETLIESLIQFGRPYIYTTGMPPALAAATSAALAIVRDESWRRETLQNHIRLFRERAARAGLDLMPSETPIQPLLLGDEERALQASEALRRQGFLVTAIRPPTVPAGTARLRITLSAAHEAEDIHDLVAALEVCCA